jgi:hypothetical protein
MSLYNTDFLRGKVNLGVVVLNENERADFGEIDLQRLLLAVALLWRDFQIS